MSITLKYSNASHCCQVCKFQRQKSLLYSQTPYYAPLYTATTTYAKKPQNRNSLCNCKGNPLTKCHPHQPSSKNICGNTNVPYSNMPFCFHQLYGQLHGIFKCKNTLDQHLCYKIKPIQERNHPQHPKERTGLLNGFSATNGRKKQLQ